MSCDNGLRINHFDLRNQCNQPDSSAYGLVNWSIDVPNGVYTNVYVDLDNSTTRAAATSKAWCSTMSWVGPAKPAPAAPTQTQ